ncbi:hypothetical protein PIB30_017532 [Stylosanthes scabra]|uniref:Uncharacterized protein n=1 Tax=Stylosanthes scabra TaxID=79078 RepID=A0ABU6S743_9FABA|nr:hypothetical protein [Stylosanthes scabra]
MGSCYSLHTTKNTNKLSSFPSKTENLVAPSPPTFTDQGSKEEAFFDSKAWLDSDCEDDFYSVNGDFTPSRGTTPVHHTFRTPSANRGSGSTAESSPEKKKKLLELFQESMKGGDQSKRYDKKDAKPMMTQDVLPKSAQSTPYLISGANSVCGSERVMSEDRASIRGKSAKYVQKCIPGLSSCRSFTERRRRPPSPAIAVNGKH